MNRLMTPVLSSHFLAPCRLRAWTNINQSMNDHNDAEARKLARPPAKARKPRKASVKRIGSLSYSTSRLPYD